MISRFYLAFIRSLPCLVCGIRRGIEAAHTGPRGLGQKSSDLSAIPLCRQHHRTGTDSLHCLGPRKFTALHSLDVPELVERLNRMGLAGVRIHGPARQEVTPQFTRARCTCGWSSVWYRSSGDSQAALHSHIEEKSHDESDNRRMERRPRSRTEAVLRGRKGLGKAKTATAADTVLDLLRVAGC